MSEYLDAIDELLDSLINARDLMRETVQNAERNLTNSRARLTWSCHSAPPPELADDRAWLRSRINGSANVAVAPSFELPQIALDEIKVNDELFLSFAIRRLRSSDHAAFIQLQNLIDLNDSSVAIDKSLSAKLLAMVPEFMSIFNPWVEDLEKAKDCLTAAKQDLLETEEKAKGIAEIRTRLISEEKRAATEKSRRQFEELRSNVAVLNLQDLLPLELEYYVAGYDSSDYQVKLGDFAELLRDSPSLWLWVIRWLTLELRAPGLPNCAGCARYAGKTIEMIKHTGTKHLRMEWIDIRRLIDQRWASLDGTHDDVDSEFWASPIHDIDPVQLLKDLIAAEIYALSD